MRLKLLIACALIAAPLVTLAQGAPEPPKVDAVIFGRRPPAANLNRSEVGFWLQQLLLSALYRDMITPASVEEWTEQLTSRSHIHYVYPGTARLALPARAVLEIDEVMVPVTGNYPDHVLIKHGSEVLRLAKYDPWVFRRLISEVDLHAAASLPVVERALF